jgi:hypothetical protein
MRRSSASRDLGILSLGSLFELGVAERGLPQTGSVTPLAEPRRRSGQSLHAATSVIGDERVGKRPKAGKRRVHLSGGGAETEPDRRGGDTQALPSRFLKGG